MPALMVAGYRGQVDSCFLWDFFPVTIILLRPHSLRAGCCSPAWLGGHPLQRATPSFQSFAAAGRRGNFHIFFVEHGGGQHFGFVSAPPTLGIFPEDSADNPAAGYDHLLSGSL